MSLYTVSNTDIPYWAITINISPNKLINKRRWKLYKTEAQESYLLRLVNKLSELNPSIVCIEKHLEKCPSNGQVHLHALYQFDPIYESTFKNWIDRCIAWKDDKSVPAWRHLDIQLVTNRNGWIDYIRKDQ